MRKIYSWDKVDTSLWRIATLNDLCSELSILNKYGSTGTIYHLLIKSLSPSSQKLYSSPSKIWWVLCARTSSNSLRTSLQKYKKMQKWDNYFRGRRDVRRVTVTQLFTDHELCGRHCHKLYIGYYKNPLLESLNHSLGTLKCSAKFQEPGYLNTIEENGSIEDRECTNLQMDCKATGTINIPSRTARLLQWERIVEIIRFLRAQSCS